MLNPSECKVAFHDKVAEFAKSLTDDIDLRLLNNVPTLQKGHMICCNLHLMILANKVYTEEDKKFFQLASEYVGGKLFSDYKEKGWVVDIDYLGGKDIFKKPILKFKMR